MNDRAAVCDADALVRGLVSLTLASFDEVERAGFRAAGDFADCVSAAKGAREAISFLDRLEGKVPVPRTEDERAVRAELFVAIGRQRADALVALGLSREVEQSLAQVARRVGPSTDASAQIEALQRQYALVGGPAPDLVADGGDRQGVLVRLRGRVLVVDFFAHFCGPCISALPQLEHLHRDFQGRGFEIVTVNRPWGFFGKKSDVDEREERSLTDALLREHRLQWPVVHGPKSNFEAYGVRSLPVAVVIDRTGRVRFVHHGYTRQGIRILRRHVETLLAEAPPPAGR
jgi:thiol-disulfide isomerase/thioredoxin